MPTFGSLFAGVGGFDLGFERAGWECRWQVEWDARCRSVLARHFPTVTRYEDVNDVAGRVGFLLAHGAEDHSPAGPLPDDHRGIGNRDSDTARDLLEPVDCITYGFPCKDLSVAGKRAGLDGDRSGLFFQATRIIREMREATDGRYPTWAVAENVPGLLSADDGHAMGRVLDELADIGAVGIEWAVLDAQHFGVPQRRRRVFIVACFDPRAAGAGPLLPVSEGCARHPQPGATAREVVAALTSTGVGTCGADDNQAQAGHLVPVVSPSLMAKVQRDHPDEEAFVAGPAGVRRLTPRECERLQGFPDDWTRWDADGNELPDSARYRMMGNAVAVPVAEWVGRQLLSQIGANA